MNLKVLLPFQILPKRPACPALSPSRTKARLGSLPHRLGLRGDARPGNSDLCDETDGETYVAVDEGVLVKTGSDVLVSVRKRHAERTSANC